MDTIKKLVKGLLFTVAAQCAGFLKISFVIGSQVACFSGVNMIVPLAGSFGGLFGSGLVFVVRLLMHFLFFQSLSLSFLAFCIPGFCASLYWATKSTLIHIALPLLCMGLFIMHPVGNQAFIYSFFWLIPVLLYYMPRKSLFLTALGSTFIAHGVGSVIWLYTVPMASALWIGLMPIVALERTIFALGMVCVYQLIFWFQHLSRVRMFYGNANALSTAPIISAS
jgi:hypothetical protein